MRKRCLACGKTQDLKKNKRICTRCQALKPAERAELRSGRGPAHHSVWGLWGRSTLPWETQTLRHNVDVTGQSLCGRPHVIINEARRLWETILVCNYRPDQGKLQNEASFS